MPDADFYFTLPSTYKARIRCGDDNYNNKMRDYLMEHINRIELRGRVGTVRGNTFNDNRVANFTMVTDYLYKNRNGEPMSEATWFNVVAWEGKDIIGLDKVEKGVCVHISGRMRTTKYTNSEGVEKQFYEVLATKMRIVEDEENTSI
jgi:single-strand DNA-binding protein